MSKATLLVALFSTSACLLLRVGGDGDYSWAQDRHAG